MRMNDFSESEVGGGVRGLANRLKKNMVALFVIAVVIGAVCKVGVSNFATIGYNDRLVKNHTGFDFSAMKEDVARKRQEEQKKAQEQQQSGTSESDQSGTIPTGGSC